MPKTIVFDVNETLLDLSALDPLFQKHFGNASTRKEWFTQVLLTSMTTTLVGDYADFAEVGSAALEMVAKRRGVEISDSEVTEILGGMRTLPAHPDAEPALETLKAAGYRVVTLTNSPPAVVKAQIANSGLSGYFDQLLSVDSVRKFKPATDVYRMAAETLQESPADLWLIAAHNWDTTGAIAAGWKAAFVEREGMVTGAMDLEPTVRAKDLIDAAKQIVARDA